MEGKYIRKLSIRLVNGEYSNIEGVIRFPKDIYQIFRKLGNKYQENLIGIYFDEKMRIIAYDTLSIGSKNTTLYCPDEILKRAILLNSKRFIIIHNHPSGNPNPSPEDKDMMIDLRNRSRILNIILLDFVIIGHNNYWSIFEKNEGGEYMMGDIDWGY